MSDIFELPLNFFYSFCSFLTALEYDSFFAAVNSLVWSVPLLLLLFGTGIYLTLLLKGVQFRYLGFAFKQIFAGQKKEVSGDISQFEALMTSLAGAIGTGSIVGVTTAITIGGFGALFWMWVTAFIGMATKYAESLLAVKYRHVDARKEMIGGPMQYIEKGLGWKRVAVAFAFLGMIAAIGTGNLVQVNSIAEALNSVWDINPWIVGCSLALLTGLVLIGGVKSIGHVAGILVPFMALFYFFGGMIIIVMRYDRIPEAFMAIMSGAFNGQAAIGGFAGSTIATAIQVGVARSVFSNEAGLGISSIAAAAAKTDLPGRQAMINMTGALISTVIVCTITGLVVGVTGVFGKTGDDGTLMSGACLAIAAFNSVVPGGGYIVTVGLVLFAFSTVIAWAYYGEKCCEYLFGEKSEPVYRVLFTLMIIPGTVLKMETVWSIADISNGLMAIPNLLAIIGLSGVIVKETDIFIKAIDKENLSL